MEIRQFQNSISDSRSVENISDKRLRIEVQPAQTKWGRKGKAFCERPFASHRQQPGKEKQNVDVPPPWKNVCGRPWQKDYATKSFKWEQRRQKKLYESHTTLRINSTALKRCKMCVQGLREKCYQGVQRPTPAPLFSWTLVKTSIACLYSNQNQLSY